MIRNQIPRGLTERGVQGCKGSVPHCHIIPLQYRKYKLVLREWEEKSWTWHGNYQEYQLWGKAQEAACRGEYKNILGKSIWKYLFIESVENILCFFNSLHTFVYFFPTFSHFPTMLSFSSFSIHHTFQGLKENLSKNKKPESDKKFMVIFLDKNCTTKVQFWTLINIIWITKQYLLFTCFTFNWPKLSLSSLT